MTKTCKGCGKQWTNKERQDARYAGFPIKENDDGILCPACIDEVKAMFISNPQWYQDYVRSLGF